MTMELALAVADRLNELGIPTTDYAIDLAVARWTEEGGTLVVRDQPDGIRIDLYLRPAGLGVKFYPIDGLPKPYDPDLR